MGGILKRAVLSGMWTLLKVGLLIISSSVIVKLL